MTTVASPETVAWTPSVYYAASIVKCRPEHAWRMLWEYPRWNPTFVGASVTPVRGAARSEGELVLVEKTLPDSQHDAYHAFYSETVKVVRGRRIAWYVYPKEEGTYHNQRDAFRNFVEFVLTEEFAGVRFSIGYYAQTCLSGKLLLAERNSMEPLLQDIAEAFRDYCEKTQ